MKQCNENIYMEFDLQGSIKNNTLLSLTYYFSLRVEGNHCWSDAEHLFKQLKTKAYSLPEVNMVFFFNRILMRNNK